MNRRERRSAAQPSGKNSAEIASDFCASGRLHMMAGRYHDAKLHGLQALAADADHADALHLMGLLSLQARQHGEAIEWISRAIRQEPRPAYLTSLGTALLRSDRRDDA